MSDISVQNPTEFLKSAFDSAVASADPKTCLPSYLKSALAKPAPGRTVVLGGGKAGGSMARAVEDFWLENYPTRPLEGLVVTRYGHAVNCDRIKIVEAGHPIPDSTGNQAAQNILSLAQVNEKRGIPEAKKKHQQDIKAKYPPTPWLKLFRKQFKVPVEFVKKYRHQFFLFSLKG